MAHKNPEERSVTGDRPPGAAPAQPTGDEVFTPRSDASAAGEEPELTAEEQEELDRLEQAVAEAYEQLGKAAERLSSRATEAYQAGRTFVKENPGSTLLTSFVIGIVVGALTSRR